MIIIDEDADSKLVKTLELARREADAGAARCFHYHWQAEAIDAAANENMRDQIVKTVREHIGNVNPEIYFCDEGDIYVMTPVIPSKDARQLMYLISEAAPLPATTYKAHFYETNMVANQILLMLEEKLEKKRTIQLSMQKSAEMEKIAKRRRGILNSAVANSPAEIARKRLGRTKPELMMIEDDPFSRRLVENVLKQQYELTALDSADMALQMYAAKAPDILFLDINLPDVNGLELLEKIMIIDPRAIVIMLSGNADQANISQAIKLGAKGFIAKPFTRDKLLQYIQRYSNIQQ